MPIPADATGLRLAGGAATMAGSSGQLTPGANTIPVAPPGSDPNADPNEPDAPPPSPTNPDGTPSTAPGGAAEPITAAPMVAENFLVHAKTAFANKFPLDVIGTTSLPAGTSSCPTFTFFTRSYELCFISDLIGFAKFPILLSFVIWAVMAL